MEYLAGGGGQSWDRYYDATLAFDADGKATAFKVGLIDDMGATAEAWGALLKKPR